ncbi:MAG: ribonuclease HII [Candidatus Methanomethylicaceae archaeon]|nr:ribonuclease HII [Candidatus Verstraetearchaeota archaeon]
MVNTKLVAGIDEAGRGPVIGPMVIAGVLIEDERVHVLYDLGVRDSKRLTPKRRERLYPEILKEVKSYHVEVVDAKVIDLERGRKNLNVIELEGMAKIISKLRPDLVQVGSIEFKTEKFRDKLLRRVEVPEIVSAHHAEDLFPAVAAASIIAKVTRDRLVAKLREIYGDFGSGYPSDPKTVEFLRHVINRGELPEFVRSSWGTVQRIVKLSSCNTRSGLY